LKKNVGKDQGASPRNGRERLSKPLRRTPDMGMNENVTFHGQDEGELRIEA